MLISHSPKLDKLKEKQKALHAEIQRVENLEKTRQRKNDTRKKILIGAYYLEKAEKEREEMRVLKKVMDEYLTHKNDRVLFGLEDKK